MVVATPHSAARASRRRATSTWRICKIRVKPGAFPGKDAFKASCRCPLWPEPNPIKHHRKVLHLLRVSAVPAISALLQNRIMQALPALWPQGEVESGDTWAAEVKWPLWR
jgi:hypothetical protein